MLKQEKTRTRPAVREWPNAKGVHNEEAQTVHFANLRPNEQVFYQIAKEVKALR
jgi:hypothetical protein